jgi:ABC-type sugar transport system ATPase subunit
VAILFISHFIEEILSLGDEITVLRSGRRVMTAPASELTLERTIRAMMGADPSKFFPKEVAAIGASPSSAAWARECLAGFLPTCGATLSR